MEAVVTGPAELRAAYRGKRVLVTGHTGFKGSWLALWLIELGAEVHGFSDRVPTTPSHFEQLDLTIGDHRGDIADQATIGRAVADIGPEVIFHLAAQPIVRRSYVDPIETYRTNVIGSLTLFEAARKVNGVRAIVSATTDKVYRNREWPWGYRETDELGGLDPYSASKSCVELMTDSYRRAFREADAPAIASVRAGNVIGGGDWAVDRLLPDIFRATGRGEPVVIRNPGSTRPWQHVLDALSGYLTIGKALLDGRSDAAEAWNFGPTPGRAVSVGDVLDRMRRTVPDLGVAYEPDTLHRHESGLLELDSSKAAQRLGWRPVWEDEMFERTAQWYAAAREDRIVSREQLTDYEAALASRCSSVWTYRSRTSSQLRGPSETS